MTATVLDLEAKALQLTPEDRLSLADRLLASLSPDAAVEEAWAAEAQRRLTELESGAVIAVPVSAAIARARNALW